MRPGNKRVDLKEVYVTKTNYLKATKTIIKKIPILGFTLINGTQQNLQSTKSTRVCKSGSHAQTKNLSFNLIGNSTVLDVHFVHSKHASLVYSRY